MSNLNEIYDVDNLFKIIQENSDSMKFRDAINDYVKKIFKKIDKSKLSPIDSKNHDVYFVNIYNKWVKNEKIDRYQFDNMVYQFSEGLFITYFLVNKSNTLEKNKEILNNFLTKNRRLAIESVYTKCNKCGHNHSIYLNGSNLELNYFLKEEAVDDCFLFTQSVKTEIEFKTGNLLIMDWFSGRDSSLFEFEKHKSLNTQIGRLERTYGLLKKYNLLSISVGNTSPLIFQKGNSIVFSNYKKGPKGFEKIGQVITDFWGISIVEEQVLLKAFEKSGMTKDQSLKELNDLKLQWYSNSATVDPGTYVLRFPAHNEYVSKFHAENFKGADVLISLIKK